jgi:DNA-binding transcriptional ArsR family regulator
VHLVPADRLDRRVIDGERICAAIETLSHHDLPRSAEVFALLGDPSRLALLVAIRAAGPISVSDLATATGLTADTTSQALRFVRAASVVTAHRDGRVIRYQLTDPAVDELLGRLAPVADRP